MSRASRKNAITGYINQHIEIWAADNISSEFGGSFQNVDPYWPTYAKINAVRSYRTQEVGRSELEMVYEFSIRYRNDRNITNDMVLKWRGCFFVIFDYNPDVAYQDYVVFKAVQTNPGNLVTT